MPNFTAGTSFTDGVTNDVTAAKLNALVADAVPTSSLALASTSGTISNFTTSTATITGAITGSTNVINIGSGQIYKDATGNVGIGTSSIAAKLHVSSANASDKLVQFGPSGVNDVNFITTAKNGVSGSTNGTPQFSLGMDYSTTYTDIAAIKFARGAGAQGNILFFTGDQANGTERLRIDLSGNVGIGITNPTAKLEITGPQTVNTVNQQWNIFSGVSAALRCGSDAHLDFGTITAHSTHLITNGTRNLSVTAAGNVGLGTTSPSAQLELSTDSAKKPSTNTWTIASDQRLKTNITNADNDRCYEIVKQVPLKRYTWKSEVYSQEKVKDRSKLGWIAQDVEAVFPKAVGTNRFAYNQVFEDVITPELDSDGNAVLDENGIAKTKTEKRLVSEDVIEDCKDLNSDQIYAAMYGTIQKLIEKVEFLESKVATLEAA